MFRTRKPKQPVHGCHTTQLGAGVRRPGVDGILDEARHLCPRPLGLPGGLNSPSLLLDHPMAPLPSPTPLPRQLREQTGSPKSEDLPLDKRAGLSCV